MSIDIGDQIREFRTDYKFRWLEQIMKEFHKESLEAFLVELEKRQDERRPLMTIEDVAVRFKVTKATVHNWINREIIVGNKVGKNRYFTEAEVRIALTRFGFNKHVNI